MSTQNYKKKSNYKMMHKIILVISFLDKKISKIQANSAFFYSKSPHPHTHTHKQKKKKKMSYIIANYALVLSILQSFFKPHFRIHPSYLPMEIFKMMCGLFATTKLMFHVQGMVWEKDISFMKWPTETHRIINYAYLHC